VALGHAELRLSEALQRDDPTRSQALVIDARDHLAKSVELQEAAKQKASESYMTETKETANGTESR
jgi:hypothetical protein